MKLLKFALRNLFRNTRRTVLTVLAIGFGLAMMLQMVFLQKGQYDGLLDRGVSAMAGHVVVQHPAWQEERDQDQLVVSADAIAREMAAAFPEATVAPRIFLGGLMTSPRGNVGAGLSAVSPEPEARVSWIDDKLVSGEWIATDRDVVLGRTMAESLDVEVGDKVVYMGQHDGTEMSSRMFRVKGIFASGSAEIDGFTAVIHIDAARVLLGREDVAHQITLHLSDGEGTEAAVPVVEGLASRAAETAVLPWWEAVPELVAYIKVDRDSGDVMMAILGLIVAMGVLNTVLMSVLERTREFGVLLAIGLKPRQLAVMVLAEGVFTGLIGAVLGIVGGVALGYPLVYWGIDLSSYMGGEALETAGVPLDAVMYGAWDPVRGSVYVGLAIVFTGLAAVYPAWHVSRLEPVDAMRAA